MAKNKKKRQQKPAHSPKQDMQPPVKKPGHRFINTEFEQEIPFSNRIILYSVIAFFLAFISWANYASLDEVARGQGKVIPSTEIQIVESLDPGIVEEILVNEGDFVKKDQPVIRLKDTQAKSDLNAQQSEYYSLIARRERLKAEARELDQLSFPPVIQEKSPESVEEELQVFRANKRKMKGKLDVMELQEGQKRKELLEATKRIKDLKAVIEISRDEYNILSSLVERGSASKVELLQLERSLKEKEAELNSLKSSLPRLRESIQEYEARKNEIISKAQAEAQESLAKTIQKINSLKERIKGLQDKKVRTVLNSPVAGIVKEVKVSSIGEVVKPGEGVVEIVPDDDKLVIEAKIRPEQIAFISPKQKAIVQITAYDFAIYGGLVGKVTSISADTITDEEGNSFYRVKILTDKSKIIHNGEVLPIIPGMIASVDIVTGEKTVMQYILKPIFRTFNTALREK